MLMPLPVYSYMNMFLNRLEKVIIADIQYLKLSTLKFPCSNKLTNVIFLGVPTIMIYTLMNVTKRVFTQSDY